MAARTLDIYFIDVEGGQSTLIVTPLGDSLLVDAGYAGNGGRDASRVVAAASQAGITRIDYLWNTHFHADHAGGIPEVARRLSVRTFVDHDTVMPDDASSAPVFKAYVEARGTSAHIVAKPGDRLPIPNLTVTVVSSGGKTITAPLSGAGQANAACADPEVPAAEPTENPRSTGFVLQYGRFRFVDLGDLSGAPLRSLVCPANLLGRADVYLVPHHGGADVVYPATFVVSPRVAILNNGEKKGGSAEAFPALRGVKSLEDVWQLHRSQAGGSQNFADDHIANLDESTGHWLKVSATEDGSFVVTNGRTGKTQTYPAKR